MVRSLFLSVFHETTAFACLINTRQFFALFKGVSVSREQQIDNKNVKFPYKSIINTVLIFYTTSFVYFPASICLQCCRSRPNNISTKPVTHTKLIRATSTFRRQHRDKMSTERLQNCNQCDLVLEANATEVLHHHQQVQPPARPRTDEDNSTPTKPKHRKKDKRSTDCKTRIALHAEFPEFIHPSFCPARTQLGFRSSKSRSEEGETNLSL